jgi:cytoskeleton protein RodZ
MFEIGNTLREARLRRRLEFREVEQATKIRSRYLRALEEEAFEALPAETYVRGFLRSYADFLGLDGQLYVDEYNSRFVTDDDYGYGPLRPRRSYAKRSRARGLETNVVLFALTAIAVMTALVIAAWKFSATPADPTRAEPAAVAEPRVRPPRRAETSSASVNLLVRAARGNCWLEVHAGSASGKLLYQGTLERGQVQRFVARRLWVHAQAPGNLVVKLNGERVPIGNDDPVVVVVTPNSVTPAQPQT